MGLVTGKSHDYDADFIFATVQTLSKKENLERFARDHFECCIYDEAHHTSADSYKSYGLLYSTIYTGNDSNT